VSDSYIILIPQDPKFVPPTQAQRAAAALFKKLAPKSDEINATVSKGIRFHDCGENFQRVLCPSCGSELEMEWWQDSMTSEAEQNFPLRSRLLPCCSATYNLNELTYDWPQGFACFSLEAMNPDIADLTASDLKQFEQILGSPLRKILQHI
jgi:hypothetical protein